MSGTEAQSHSAAASQPVARADAEHVRWLQRTVGNAAVTHLLSRERLARARSRQRRTGGRLLQRQAADPEDRTIVAVAERAFAAGGPTTWSAATKDIVQRIVRSRFPERLGRLGDITYSTELRQVKPGMETGGKLQLIATDTVVRYVHNGYLKYLVRQVEAAFLRSEIEHEFSIVIVDGSEDWSLSDVRDLQQGLKSLGGAELRPVAGTRFIRVGATADPDADAITRVEGTDKRVQLGDGVFGRRAGAEGGLTVYGGSVGIHGIVHECGHVIEFQNNRAAGSAWQAIYNRLRRNQTKISSEPKGDPTKQPADEVFAEAFARFHTDPGGLKTTDAATHAFFKGGRHL
jgi:hypothetical protein